jgi:tripartite-type tricarboxylate transporter receptor subunit TctC
MNECSVCFSRRFATMAAVLGIATAVGAPVLVSAQDYPVKPVRIIVPLAPGGISDNIARTFAQKIAESSKASFIVENRAGGSSVIGTELVARAAPDGYTLLMSGSGPFGITPNLQSKLPYDARKDFAPIIHFVTLANFLVVHPSVPAKSLKEFVALLKAKPGALSYASQGIGSTGHITGEQFKQIAGLDVVHVPYKGAAPAVQDLLGGQVAMMFDSVMVSNPHVKAGKLRALAITSAARNPGSPDVPTMAEAGISGIEGGAWFGLSAPAGTPRPIVDYLNREGRRIFSEPELRERLILQGATIHLDPPEVYAAHIESELQRWGRVIRGAGIKPE